MQACPRCRANYPDDVAECPADGTTLLPTGMMPAEDPAVEPGTMIGEYRVDRKLGSGTFGDVYAGEQPVIGKRVAIKLLHRKFSSDAEVVSRFVAEARAVNRIRHRHIIDIFSFGMHGDRHYFVMELLDGLTLGELMHRERRLSIDGALPIFRGIASGLDAAHEAGITHRDLKPDNVFLAIERDGSFFVKLLDFGIAKLVGDDLAHKTATGMAMGTPRYMSPEQCRGKAVDHRADIYSLGVVIHEVLTGRPLFDGDSSMDVLFKHTTEAPPHMSAVRPDLPPELDEAVLAMLAKKPKSRPASAGAAVAELIERAKAQGHAEALSASSQPNRDTTPASAPRGSGVPKTAGSNNGAQGVSARSGERAIPTEDIDTTPRRLGTDDPTVAVRPRDGRPAPTRDGAGSRSRDGAPSNLRDVAARTPISQEAASDAETAATLAVSSAGQSSGAVSVHFSTEIAPMSKNGTMLDEGAAPASAPDTASSLAPSAKPSATLRSPGPLDAAAQPAARRSERGAGFWAGVAGVAIAVVAGVVVLSRSGSDQRASGDPTAVRDGAATATATTGRSDDGATDRASASSAPNPGEMVTVHVKVAPPEAWLVIGGQRTSAHDPLVLPKSSQSQALRVEADGFEAETVWVTPDKDKDLDPIALSHVAPMASAPPSTGSPSAQGTTGKPIAKKKDHGDLERPPELNHPR